LIRSALVILVAALLLACPCPGWSKEPTGGLRREEGALTILVLKGTPAERGEQLGRLAGEEVKAVVKERLIEGFIELNFGDRADLFYKEIARREPLIPECIKDELRALAKSSGARYEDLLGLQFVPPIRPSAFAAVRGSYTKDGAFVAGLQDGPSEFPVRSVKPFVTVTHPQGGEPYVTVEYPGILGVTSAFTQGGMAVFFAWSPSLDGSAGVPDALLLERALCSSRDNESFINSFIVHERVYGGNLAIISPDRKDVTLLEMSSNFFVRSFMEGDALAVTNHYRSQYMNYLVEEKLPMSEERFDELKRRLESEKGKLDVSELDRLLREGDLFSDFAKICVIKGDDLFVRLADMEKPVTLSLSLIFSGQERQ
jgi:hypothetical protein